MPATKRATKRAPKRPAVQVLLPPVPCVLAIGGLDPGGGAGILADARAIARTGAFACAGWPDAPLLLIGLIELVCLALYTLPRTAVLGAVLLMAVLGGAFATQLRAGSPLFSHLLFSVYLGLFMWGGLWLREPALRALFPLRR